MYRINRTQRNVLIIPDEVLFHSPSTGEEGERQLLQNIIPAEERWIANALGYDFYEYICEMKNAEVTEDNKTELLAKIKVDYAKDKKEFSDDMLQVGMIVNALEFVTDEWIVKLWKQYLWKITAECVDLMNIVPSWLKTAKAGQQLENPNNLSATGSASGNMKEVAFKMDNAMLERIDPMLERMHQWLCRNKQYFPKYTKSCDGCGCIGDEKNKNVTPNVGFAFGHYD